MCTRLALALLGTLVHAPIVAAQSPATARGTAFVMHMRTTPVGDAPLVAASMDAMKSEWTGKVIATLGRGRIDVTDAAEGSGNRIFKKGDYMLFDTSGSIVVTPAEQVFASLNVDPGKVIGATGAEVTFKDVKVTFDSLGAGEPIAGIPTRRYRLTSSSTMTMSMPSLVAAGVPVPTIETTTTMDYWVGAVPFPPTPFVRGSPDIKVDSTNPTFELTAKVVKAMKSLPTGMIPLKMLTATRTNMGSMGSMGSDQLFELSEIQAADIDLDRLTLPGGFTQRALNGLPMTPFSAAALEKWKTRP
jgi:hypothetical protein